MPQISKLLTRSANATIGSAEINAEFDNIINNMKPSGIDGEATTLPLMQATTDPYSGGVAAFNASISLQTEIKMLRYLIAQITGETYWYIDPDVSLTGIATYGMPVYNLKMARSGASAKILLIQTKSGGDVPDAANPIGVAIPDGTGRTYRSRTAAVVSGTSQITMADATSYWSKGSLDGELKNAYLYAIWSTADAGIVWALAGYSGFLEVQTTTTATDPEFMLLEDSSTYSRVGTDYCVCVGKIRYEYDTGDTPDHTIQNAGEDAPLVVYNPKSDYGYSTTLATTITGTGADIADRQIAVAVVKQTGKYLITGHLMANSSGGAVQGLMNIRTGSGTYGSATTRANAQTYNATNIGVSSSASVIVNIAAGSSIHLGGSCVGAGGANRLIYGDNDSVGATMFSFYRVD